MRRLALRGAVVLLLFSVSSTFAVTANSVWRTKLTIDSIKGGATLAELANGTAASVAVKLYNVKPSTTVTVTLHDGACPGTATIAGRLTVKAPASGPAVHRVSLNKTQLAALQT